MDTTNSTNSINKQRAERNDAKQLERLRKKALASQRANIRASQAAAKAKEAELFAARMAEGEAMIKQAHRDLQKLLEQVNRPVNMPEKHWALLRQDRRDTVDGGYYANPDKHKLSNKKRKTSDQAARNATAAPEAAPEADNADTLKQLRAELYAANTAKLVTQKELATEKEKVQALINELFPLRGQVSIGPKEGAVAFTAKRATRGGNVANRSALLAAEKEHVRLLSRVQEATTFQRLGLSTTIAELDEAQHAADAQSLVVEELQAALA